MKDSSTSKLNYATITYPISSFPIINNTTFHTLEMIVLGKLFVKIWKWENIKKKLLRLNIAIFYIFEQCNRHLVKMHRCLIIDLPLNRDSIVQVWSRLHYRNKQVDFDNWLDLDIKDKINIRIPTLCILIYKNRNNT